MRDAVVEVAPDNQKAYGDPILKLFADAKFYDSKPKACAAMNLSFMIAATVGALLSATC